MDDLAQVRALREERDRTTKLLDAYNAVRLHLVLRLNPGAITLSVIDEQRRDLTLLIGEACEKAAAIQFRCSHAWERIGEAKPPFRRCVRCDATTPEIARW